jgi:uncharacterized protein (DUF427 family)
MMKAIWNNKIIAQSDSTVEVEGNHYFPRESVNAEYLQPSEHKTVCSWKGDCSYYDVVVDGKRNPSAAWYYPAPKEKAKRIRDHIAFWNGVTIVKE